MWAVTDVAHRIRQPPGKICGDEILVQLVDFMSTVGHKFTLLFASCTAELA